jgi:hypothetical protein
MRSYMETRPTSASACVRRWEALSAGPVESVPVCFVSLFIYAQQRKQERATFLHGPRSAITPLKVEMHLHFGILYTVRQLSECILRKQLRFPEIALTHPPDTFCAVYGRA